MAGETDDCMTLQAEHLPTGSISFGRFELENLSWEKRSSFNHNRYLEEVEKYSRPGSVTQTRAILEAHFKKKSLIPQTSLENKSNTECPVLHREASCSDKFEDRIDERQPESASCGDTSIGLDKREVMECEQEEVTLPAKSLVESMSCNNERIVGPTNELAEHDSLPSKKDDLCIVVEHEPDNKAVIMEELLEKKEIVVVEELKSCASSKSSATERKKLPTSKKKTKRTALKVKEEADRKTEKPIRKEELPAQKNMRKPSTERSHISSGKMFSNSMAKQGRESSLITKSVKQTQPRTSRPRSLESRSLKSEEDHVNMRAKVEQAKGRPNGVVDSAKEETKPTRVAFNLKSDERAEKRKEYFMKLEEKLHAKQVEMNEIQTKTQEETQAAIKQLRRNLNFKATPMPSFYREAMPKVSGGPKMLAPPSKPQAKDTSLGSQKSAKEKTQSLSKHHPKQAQSK